jgi:hypothetical protein
MMELTPVEAIMQLKDLLREAKSHDDSEVFKRDAVALEMGINALANNDYKIVRPKFKNKYDETSFDHLCEIIDAYEHGFATKDFKLFKEKLKLAIGWIYSKKKQKRSVG